MLRASTNSASQTQQVTNHGIFSKYFEKTKQDKNQNQTTNSDSQGTI